MSTRKSYPSDLTDEQWDLIRPLLPKRKTKVGAPTTVDRRDLLDAVFYLLRTGCQWRQLPHDFPPWGTVASQFHRWRTSGVWEKIHHALHARARQYEGKAPRPTAAILDSQSVKTAEGGPQRGYDAGKNVCGRKRHLLVDTLGLLIACVVHAADVQDYDGCEAVLDKAKARFPGLKKIWADSRYACLETPRCVKLLYGWVLEIVRRAAGAVGFVVLHRRWVVERTFGWLVCFRRLSKDYERNPRVSETMVYVALIHLMLRRLRPRC
jgi:putative transposase